MVGQILTRFASVLLLPLYTHMLLPADYGTMAILDLTAAIFSTFLANGMVSAVTRHHFEGDDARQKDKVWWTGMTMVTAVSTVVCLVMYFGRQTLSDVTLGPEVTEGAWFYTLTILTMGLTVMGMILDAYIRVIKWSGVFVVISMLRLLLNIGINVWLLVGKGMGVEGLLIGNLIATCLQTIALGVVFLKTRGKFAIDSKVGRDMLQFAGPLVFSAIAGMLMHELDRFLLRIWSGLDSVGVYSLAHRIGFAVHTLCLLPFLSIWHVAIYEIETLPEPKQIFSRVFGWFTAGIGILFLGASLTVHPILPLLTPENYGDSIDLISLILLGFFVFALSFMFEVPSLLTKQTKLMIPGSIVGVLVNVSANIVLIPAMGAWGAAWAGVLTYAAYSATLLFCCRKAIVIHYPWTRFAMTVTSLCGAYVFMRYGLFPYIGQWQQLASSVLICACFAAVMFGREGLQLALDGMARMKARRAGNRKNPEGADEGLQSPETLVTTE